MRIFQLNIEAGKRLEQIANYIKEEDYDIITLQELASDERFQFGYKKNFIVETNKYPTLDCYQELSNRLPDWQGILLKSYTDSQGKNYFGNAIFYKKELKLHNTEEIWMTPKSTVEIENEDHTIVPYTALAAKFSNSNNEKVTIVGGHFTWSLRPYDTDSNIKRAAIVKDYLTSLSDPFILTGDFNVHYNTITCRQFEDLAVNLTAQLRITNTLNQKFHRAQNLFPTGIACDQMFISQEISPISFGLVTADLSDHYGLELEFSVGKVSSYPIGGIE